MLLAAGGGGLSLTVVFPVFPGSGNASHVRGAKRPCPDRGGGTGVVGRPVAVEAVQVATGSLVNYIRPGGPVRDETLPADRPGPDVSRRVLEGWWKGGGRVLEGGRGAGGGWKADGRTPEGGSQKGRAVCPGDAATGVSELPQADGAARGSSSPPTPLIPGFSGCAPGTGRAMKRQGAVSTKTESSAKGGLDGRLRYTGRGRLTTADRQAGDRPADRQARPMTG